MPHPIDLLLDPLSITLFLMFAGLMLWEKVAPARPMPHMPWWHARMLTAFCAYFIISTYLPLFLGETLSALQLFDLNAWGTLGGAAAGLLAYHAAAYAWHRSMHTFTPLWRVFHQMHHSAERLDSYSAFWFSPADMVAWTLLPSVCLTLIGITPEAATAVILSSTFVAIFSHSNIRTPRWIGYLVQRPESHSLHHARDLHAGNYADLPVFDMLFGTFHNPREFSAQAGFYDGASLRVVDMMLARDVTRP